jgi:Family of unknown function (DUF6286)
MTSRPENPPSSARETAQGTRSHRPWGARRVTAAVAALVILLVAGCLLFETVWERTGNSPTVWWSSVSSGLANRPVDDSWILAGASLAVALGFWLIVLAVTPGMRRGLPLRVPSGGAGPMSAAVDRAGAALVLRDAAMRVPGVGAARVTVRRRRVKVVADVGFRELQDVKTEVTGAVHREERERLALARAPRLKVRVRRAKR